MKVNECPGDRLIRLVLGGGLLYYGLAGLEGLKGHAAGIVVAVVGGVLLFTAATGFCALYKLFGINTCKIKQAKTKAG